MYSEWLSQFVPWAEPWDIHLPTTFQMQPLLGKTAGSVVLHALRKRGSVDRHAFPHHKAIRSAPVHRLPLLCLLSGIPQNDACYHKLVITGVIKTYK